MIQPNQAIKWAWSLLVFLSPFVLEAQNKTAVDSLEYELKKSAADTHKVRLYFQLYAETAFNAPKEAEAYIQAALELALTLNDQRGIILSYDKLGGVAMQNSDFDKALSFYRKADSLLQYIDWPREKAIIYGNYAAILKDQSQYDSSLVWLEKFIDIAKSIANESFIAFGHNLKGDIYHLKGQHELAARNYLQALRIYEQLNEPDRLADALRLLGATQTSAGHYADAELNLREAIRLYLEVKDDYYLSQAYRDMGYLYQLEGQLDSAAEYYNQSLEISRRLEDAFGIAQVFDNLGELAYLKGQFELANQQYLQALELYEEMGDRYSAGVTHRSLADSWIKLQKYDLALSEIEQAERILLPIESPTSMKFVYKSYYELYKATNKPALALNAFEQYTTINDSLNSVAKTRQLEELQLIYRVEKKDQEIAMLGKDIELGLLRRRLLTFGLLASLLIGSLVIYMQLMRRKRERKIEEERHLRQAAELEKSKLERDQLERELAGQVLQLCRKNELLASLQQEVGQMKVQSSETNKPSLQRMERTIQSDIQSDEDWRQFLLTFEKIHPDFLSELRRHSQKLSPAEQRLSCLFKMNLSSKEIATLLNITDEGVKKARYRLRKKLDLSSDINLQDYLINFPDKILSN